MTAADITSAGDGGAADLVLLGARLYHPGAPGSVDGAIAVRDGRILRVGGEAEVLGTAGEGTEILHVDGALIVPGFQDAHIHPILGGVERLQCDLGETRSREECFAGIVAYGETHPDEPWVLGSGWSPEFFPGGSPHRRELDELVPDRPALLGSRDHHSVWANSAALRLAGIARDTPDPVDGRIGRDADGEPDGNLYEGAMALARAAAPQVDLDLATRGLIATQEYLHSVGVTSWQDAILGYDLDLDLCIDAYLEAERRGRLTMRTTGCIWWERGRGIEQLPAVDAADHRLREGLPPERWRGTGVKIMVDGVTESGTAALSRPYRDGHGRELAHFGHSYFDPEELKQHLVAIDAAGYTVHFHALGDRAVTEALDAVAEARRTNGMPGRPHHLAHLQLVASPDLPRFAELDATANLQMFWASAAPPNTEHTMPFVSPEFAERLYPFGELHRAGAPLAAGSDWPVTTPDPIAALHVGVNRALDHDEPPFGGASLRLDLATALTAYTAGTARINGHAHETGRLEPGFLADLAVIDRDLFALPEHRIGEARVLRTYVGGRPVYEAEQS